MEDWVTIKTLRAKNPKLSLREIARLVGISHHTAKSALALDAPPEYQRIVRANPQLDPFRDVIEEMANVKRFKGSRILDELRSKGYKGGKTAFYQLFSLLKIKQRRHYTPYETLPGEQSQFDWSPYLVLIAGILTRIIIYSYINGFSRFQVFSVSLRENQSAAFEAMEQGFIVSGGVPSRTQIDNAKVFVFNASRTNFQWNKHYLHFCGHYGFDPSRSLPGHPWSKGKVEKPFEYLENHFIQGASFESMDDLAGKLKAFETRVNDRVHATLKTTPAALIAEDRRAFTALPESRYVGVNEETRKVTLDCLFSYCASRYSVPWFFAGQEVWVRVSRGYTVEVYSAANALIATHRLATVKGSLVIDKTHYRTQETSAGNLDRLTLRFRERFPDYEHFLEKLLAQKRINVRHHLASMLDLAALYHGDDVRRALDTALEYNIFTVRFMTGYLEKHFQQSFTLPETTVLCQYLPSAGEVTRDLNDYRMAVHA